MTGHRRITVHPDLSPAQVKRLHRALDAQRRPPRTRGEERMGPGAAALSCAVFCTVGVPGMIVLPVVVADAAPEGTGALFFFLTLVGWLVLVVAAAGLLGRRGGRRRVRRKAREVEVFEGRFVSSDMLDRPARELLERARTAVDVVLDSSLHERGVLLDEVRNRVVLADVEWSLAEALLVQSRARRRIAATPVSGRYGGEAEKRARAALRHDVAEVEARVGLLESYAEKVHDAELAERDRRSAGELDEITADVVRSGAAHPHHTETLARLVEAQEAALRVAALAD